MPDVDQAEAPEDPASVLTTRFDNLRGDYAASPPAFKKSNSLASGCVQTERPTTQLGSELQSMLAKRKRHSKESHDAAPPAVGRLVSRDRSPEDGDAVLFVPQIARWPSVNTAARSSGCSLAEICDLTEMTYYAANPELRYLSTSDVGYLSEQHQQAMWGSGWGMQTFTAPSTPPLPTHYIQQHTFVHQAQPLGVTHCRQQQMLAQEVPWAEPALMYPTHYYPHAAQQPMGPMTTPGCGVHQMLPSFSPPILTQTVNQGTWSYLELAKDKEGSQYLQACLTTMPAAELRRLMQELSPKLAELSTHPYGNYLVKALTCKKMAHRQITAALKGRMVKLMQHPQSCRVVQRALEQLPRATVRGLVGELRGRVTSVAMDREGKYSVLCALKHSREPWIMAEVASALPRLCTSRDGSLFLQRLLDPQHKILPMPASGPGSLPPSDLDGLDHGCDVGPVLDALCALDRSKLEALASDEFANFVVKLGILDVSHREALISILLPCIPRLIVTRWGSHVAKVIVGFASAKQLEELKGSLSARELRTHAYASFVMVALERAYATSGVSR